LIYLSQPQKVALQTPSGLFVHHRGSASVFGFSALKLLTPCALLRNQLRETIRPLLSTKERFLAANNLPRVNSWVENRTSKSPLLSS